MIALTIVALSALYIASKAEAVEISEASVKTFILADRTDMGATNTEDLRIQGLLEIDIHRLLIVKWLGETGFTHTTFDKTLSNKVGAYIPVLRSDRSELLIGAEFDLEADFRTQPQLEVGDTVMISAEWRLR